MLKCLRHLERDETAPWLKKEQSIPVNLAFSFQAFSCPSILLPFSPTTPLNLCSSETDIHQGLRWIEWGGEADRARGACVHVTSRSDTRVALAEDPVQCQLLPELNLERSAGQRPPSESQKPTPTRPPLFMHDCAHRRGSRLPTLYRQ